MSGLCRTAPTLDEEVDCFIDYFAQVLLGTEDQPMLVDALWGLCYIFACPDEEEQRTSGRRLLTAGLSEDESVPERHPVFVKGVACTRTAIDAPEQRAVIPALRLLGMVAAMNSSDLMDSMLRA